MSDLFDFYEKEIEKLKLGSQFREPKNIEYKSGNKIIVDKKEYLNLSSNNYLGINFDDYKEVFLNSLTAFEMGSTSARLLSGSSNEYIRLEENIRKLYEKSGVVLFNSGYHANVGIISSLVKKGDVIFSDKLNHASIIDGMKLSDAKFYRYKHLDYENLESQLKNHRQNFGKALIITESVFSMDGDIANLKNLVELKEKYNAILMVDEAHAFGVFGQKGLGICEEENLVEKIDLIVGVFGKAIASMGAFVCCNKTLADYIQNNARSFIFSTALPSINIAWTNYVITNILPTTFKARQELIKQADKLRERLTQSGQKTLGKSQIVPIIIGENQKTLEQAIDMQSKGFYVLPIRPPTVPIGSSRLRLSLCANMDFDRILKVFDEEFLVK